MASKIKTLLINTLNSVDRFFNALARIRTAAYFARCGMHKEAKAIMMKK